MLLPLVLLAFGPAAHCSNQELASVFPQSLSKQTTSPKVFFESLAASPISLDVASFKVCFQEKLLPAKADCMGETCTSQCKASFEKVLPTLDGSCCDKLEGTPDEKTCAAQISAVIVPMIRAKIAAECPSVFFESLAASPTSLDGASFQTCFMEKLRPARADCAGETCTSQCKASLEKVLHTLDGSCCVELAGTPQEKMCQGQITGMVVPMLRAKIAAECPSVFFESLAASPTSLDGTSVQTCLQEKLMPAKADCARETCTSQCKASLEKLLPTLDGSCCEELGAGTLQEKRCQGLITGVIVPMTRAKIAAECPSVLKANAPAAGLGMSVFVAVAFAGGAIAAVAVAAVTSSRREIVTSPLLG